MNTSVARNRRVGLAVLATLAVVAVILLVPGIALGLSSNYDTTKDIYKVGEDVVGNASILFNGASEEVAQIASVKLTVQPKAGSSKPGSESFFDIVFPIDIGNHDLTSSLPANMQSRGSTLEIDVTWTDLGPAAGGYAVGYKGATNNARIDFVIRWTPPIKKQVVPAALTPLNAPVVAFPNPGAVVGGGATLNTNSQFAIPGFDPVAPTGATVLGLAFDRFNGTLLTLMDNPILAGNDTILVVDPTFGFILDSIDTGTPDAEDVAWVAEAVDSASLPFSFAAGTVWVAIQSGGTQQIQQVVPPASTDTPISLSDGLPSKVWVRSHIWTRPTNSTSCHHFSSPTQTWISLFTGCSLTPV